MLRLVLITASGYSCPQLHAWTGLLCRLRLQRKYKEWFRVVYEIVTYSQVLYVEERIVIIVAGGLSKRFKVGGLSLMDLVD